MKFDFVVLGASGMQGRIVSRDLLEKNYRVLLTDIIKGGSLKNLERFPKAVFRFADNRHPQILTKLIKQSGASTVINCAESDWNLNVHKACLAARVNVVDLDSDIAITAKQLALDTDFAKHNLTAITGCGSTPGINNVMFSFAAKQFDSIETVVAGFAWTSNLKRFVMPFSLHSIVWELTHPATILCDGEFKSKPPLSESIETNFPWVGPQRARLVEHTEVFTFNHYFKNKGVKNIRFYAGFPEHSLEKLQMLVEIGLADIANVPVLVNQKVQHVSPLAVINEAARALPQPVDYIEKEVLWVELSGERHGENKTVLMECIVPTLPGWEDAGCNVDTGLPAAIIAEMIKDGRINKRGSFAPEAVVPHEELFRELGKRNMIIFQDGVVINKESLSVATSSRRHHKHSVVRAFL